MSDDRYADHDSARERDLARETSDGPEFYFNGEKLENEEALIEALKESQECMIENERKIAEEFGVTNQTAAAISYLRTRSRWTQEKEDQLIVRDRLGMPISLGTVLSGDF